MAKMGVVVDFQDAVPGRQRRILKSRILKSRILEIGRRRAAQQSQWPDVVVHPGDAFVENQGVGQNCAGHPAGLRHVGHSQQSGDVGRDSRAQLRHPVQDGGRPLDAAFQGIRGPLHLLLRDGHQSDQVGQVGYGAGEPAGLGETAAIFVADAIGQRGGGQCVGQVVGGGDGGGIAQGDGGLDGTRGRL